MPRAESPAVVILAPESIEIVPLLPPLPPLPPWLWNTPETYWAAPPSPPTLCARMPCAESPVVLRTTPLARFTVIVPPAPPAPPLPLVPANVPALLPARPPTPPRDTTWIADPLAPEVLI